MALSAAVAWIGENSTAMAPRIGKESPSPMAAGFPFLLGKPSRFAQVSRTSVLIIWGIDPATGTKDPVRERYNEQRCKKIGSKNLRRDWRLVVAHQFGRARLPKDPRLQQRDRAYQL